LAENRYWFARRFPVGHPRNAMSPVTPEGWAVVKAFISWMVGGAVAAVVIGIAAIFTTPWLAILSPIVFVGCAAYGAWFFISQAQNRGDHQHTVGDYKQGRVT
jgi:hypothetical protein